MAWAGPGEVEGQRRACSSEAQGWGWAVEPVHSCNPMERPLPEWAPRAVTGDSFSVQTEVRGGIRDQPAASQAGTSELDEFQTSKWI